VYLFFLFITTTFFPFFTFSLPSFLPHTTHLHWLYQVSHCENRHILLQFVFRWMQHYRAARTPAKHWNQQTRHC
jgi:hypothetical protein